MRFPSEKQPNPTTTVAGHVEVAPPLSKTTESSNWTTIKPSKTENVQIIGNYSIAVQQINKNGIGNEENMTPSSTPSLLEMLNVLRKLPREKLVELYLGEGGFFIDTVSTSTESVLEFLNQLREQPMTTTTTSATTTTKTTNTTETSNSMLMVTTMESPVRDEIVEDSTENPFEDTTTAQESFLDEEDESPNITSDAKNLTENSTPHVPTESQSNRPPTTTTTKLFSNAFRPPLIDSISNAQNGSSSISATTARTNHQQPSSSTNKQSTTYEFTDYPPPLPPRGFERESTNSIPATDTSFAVGVAVGILACVVVASTGVTWCVCRRHWGRRNVYATMEAEEIPRAFTKPGPPVILPKEFHQATRIHTLVTNPGDAGGDIGPSSKL